MRNSHRGQGEDWSLLLRHSGSVCFLLSFHPLLSNPSLFLGSNCIQTVFSWTVPMRKTKSQKWREPFTACWDGIAGGGVLFGTFFETYEIGRMKLPTLQCKSQLFNDYEITGHVYPTTIVSTGSFLSTNAYGTPIQVMPDARLWIFGWDFYFQELLVEVTWPIEKETENIRYNILKVTKERRQSTVRSHFWGEKQSSNRGRLPVGGSIH